MKAVENVDSLRGLLGDHPQVGPPHVAADELDRRTSLPAHHPEETEQGLGCAIPPDPEQTPAGRIDLIHHGQVAMPLLELDLVHADRGHAVQTPALQAVFDDPAHAAVDVLPAGPEDRGHLAPTQATCPAGQEHRVRMSQTTLALRPRDHLDGHAASRAIHPTFGVDEINADGPQRHKGKAPRHQVIVRGSPTPTAGAVGP